MIPGLRTAFHTNFEASSRLVCRTHQGLQGPHRQALRHCPPWQGTWQTYQRRAYSQRPFQYRRFQQTGSLLRRWAARPTFYYEIGGVGLACGGFYAYNLETVPISGRRRFNIVSYDTEASAGASMYADVMREYGNRLLPPQSREHRMVRRVLDRLIPHAGLENANWEVHVIEDRAQRNAFVIPGGKVFVFTGILDICKDDDGLAAVLGHEIAHNVAHHAAERMSQAGILLPIAILGSLLLGLDVGIGRLLGRLAFELPGSRAQESEADHIGLLIMAQSCFDPTAAARLWEAMEIAEKAQGVSVPQFISTHPSSHNRLEKIHNWLPDAELQRENSDCASTGSYGGSRWVLRTKWHHYYSC